jgi:hypothetical protein
LAQSQASFLACDADSGWGALRIWNDDEIAPNSGFPPHIHANMEIITYVREGAVSHRDSLGNADRIAAGDVQVMSAGTGIQHTEFNLEPQNRLLCAARLQLGRLSSRRISRRSLPGRSVLPLSMHPEYNKASTYRTFLELSPTRMRCKTRWP